MRKGKGKGLGKGYKNLVVQDPVVHSNNAKGISSNTMIQPPPPSPPKPNKLESMSSDELQNKAIEEKTGLFQKNIYEEELLRREKEKAKLDYKKAKLKAEREQREANLQKKIESVKEKARPLIEKARPVTEKAKEQFENIKTTTTKYLDDVKDKRAEIKALTNQELKTLAIKEGRGLFGGQNIYERELLRREKTKLELEDSVKKEKLKTKKEIQEKNSDGDFLGFIKF